MASEVIPVLGYGFEPKGPVPHINALLEQLRSIGYGKDFDVDYIWGNETDGRFIQNVQGVLRGLTYPAKTVPMLVVSGEHATELAIAATRDHDAANPKNIVCTMSMKELVDVDEANPPNDSNGPRNRNWCGSSSRRKPPMNPRKADFEAAQCLKYLLQAYPPQWQGETSSNPNAIRQVGVLFNPSDRQADWNKLSELDTLTGPELEAAGIPELKGVSLTRLAITSAADIQPVLNSAVDEIDGLLVLGGWIAWMHRSEITQFALAQHWPSMFMSKQFVMARGLLALGPDVQAMYVNAARHIGPLRGMNPKKAYQRKVDAPAAFDMFVNERTEVVLGKPIDPAFKEGGTNVKPVWL
jgi:hypothetical protein